MGYRTTLELAPSGGQPAVLIIEDDAAVRDALSEFLAEEGLTVVGAAEGAEALEVLRNGLNPVAIFLDVMMPPMDGWDFRQRQLSDPKLAKIPTIVISAAGFSAESVKAQFGDVEYIPKPISLLALLDALERRGIRAANRSRTEPVTAPSRA